MGAGSRLLTPFVVTLALASAPASAHADERPGAAGVFVGGTHFDTDNELGNSFFDDQTPGAGPLFGLRATYRFASRFGVELEGLLSLSTTDGGDGRPSISTTILGYRAHGVFYQPIADALDLFALAGFGAETAIFDDPPSGLAIDSPDTDTAAHWGLGAAYSRGSYGVRLDLRQLLSAGRDDELSLSHELHLGVFLRFGGGGGERIVIEKIVEKPGPPAPARPLDSDGDGFPDDQDQCPRDAEITNNIDDDDGCPEIDSDNDGLLGTRDTCPDAAEDPDGFEDDDGCPDLDNDNDGRADRIDACPMEPEVLNGFEDDDGCPDEVPKAVAEFTGVIKGIRFKRGSARILRASHRTLDRAVALFEKYPSLTIEVSGHTDNAGSHATNLALSRKRADRVKWYLVDHGIESDRIMTVGYGPERPIATNDSRKGRAKNRRIEFQLVPGPTTITDLGDAAPTPRNEAPAPAEESR